MSSRSLRVLLFLLLAIASTALGQTPPQPILGPVPTVTVPPGLPSGALEIAIPLAPTFPTWFDTTSRSAIANAFTTYWVPTAPTSVNWTGSVDANNPGTTSVTYQNNALQRINWVRALAGVPAAITFTSTFNTRAQAAALIMSANNNLSHDPPSSWKDWTQVGHDAAGVSNLCLGYSSPEYLSQDPGCVQGYMNDTGSNNTEVGHRRWLLVPEQVNMGTGDVTQFPANTYPPTYWSANAVYWQDGNFCGGCTGGGRPATRDTFVAWPPKGYVPYQVIPANTSGVPLSSRWSVSYANANFTNATVTMSSGGNNISVTLLPVQPTFGSGQFAGENTLVWVPNRDFTVQPPSDTTVHVTIGNISGYPGGSTIQYDVIIFDPYSGTTLQAPTLTSPTNGATGVPTSTTLSWTASTGATSYDVWIGSPTPAFLVTVTIGTSQGVTLSAGATYSWYVIARNNTSTAQSTTFSFTTAGGSPPGAPTLTSPANGATGVSTSASLTWSAATGATSYDVYFGTANPPTTVVTNTTSLSYSPSMAAGTVYYWKVVAKNSSGSTSSSIFSFTTAGGGSPPGAPTLTSPANGATGVSTSASLTWSAATGAANYDVYFGTANPPTTVVATNTTNLSFSPTMAAGTVYYWKVVAKNAFGSTASSIFSFTTAGGGSPPGAPTLTSPANNATGVSTSASLTWSAGSGATSYDVYFGTANPPTTVVTNTTSLSYSPSMAAGTVYYWKVVAKNSSGSTSSSIFSFTTAGGGGLQPPTLISPANGATNVSVNPTLSWSAVTGATSYDVYLGTPTAPPLGSPNGNVTGTSTGFSGALTASTTYSWYIVARNASGTSAPSSTWSFTTAGGGGLQPPTLISPANGAAGVSVNPTLSWSAVTGATSYDVYLGTPTAPPLGSPNGNVTGTSTGFSGALTASTTYSWYIVARNGSITSAPSSTWSFTTAGGGGLLPPTLISPANGAAGVSVNPTLSWSAVTGATSYDVYLGTPTAPPLGSPNGNVTGTSTGFSGALTASTTYSWYIVARNDVAGTTSAPSSTWSFTTAGSGGGLSAPTLMSPANGATGVSTSTPLFWSAVTGATSYDIYIGGSQPPGYDGNVSSNGASFMSPLSASATYYWYIVARNDLTGTTSAPSATFSFTTGTALRLVPVAPCRVLDTRSGSFIPAGGTRTVPVLSSACGSGIPSSVAAYSLNITVVPRNHGPLGYLTVWPTGQPQPVVSTLNAPDGSVLANAAIVPAGTGGSINAFALNDTDLVIDINGYFVPPGANTLQFYPLTPCRVLDTRNPNGNFGGPAISSGNSRSFPILSSACLAGAPATAAAFSFNITVVPRGTLGYLTAYPTGQAVPNASTLNSLDGTVLANAAIVPAGAGGSVSFFAFNTTDLVVDINGYFAPPGMDGLDFFTVTPCRVVDTRNSIGPLGGMSTTSFLLPTGSCGLPDTAAAYSLNTTVVPSGPLGYLTIWPYQDAQPGVSTLNAPKGLVVANAALVPAGSSGGVSVFVLQTTQVILDTNGYFQ